MIISHHLKIDLKDELKQFENSKKIYFSDCFNFRKTYSYPRDYEVNFSNLHHVHYGDIHTKFPNIITKDITLPHIKNEKQNYITLLPGDIVVADASEDHKDLGKSVLFEDAERNVIAGLHTHFLRNKNNIIDSKYYLYFTKTDTYIREMRRLGTGISVLGISKANLSKIKIPYEPLENQMKIAVILSQIDNLILLKKDKITTLTSSRKYLASKIITSYDSEEFLLKDLIEYISNERVVDTKNYEKLTVSLHKKGLKKLTNITEKKDTRPFYIRRKNEIIVGKQNYFNGSIALISEEFDKCIASNAIVSFKLKKYVNPNYVFEILSDSNFYRKKEILANGTGQKELSESELIKFNINLPSLHIQNLVSSVLSQMDNYIKAISIWLLVNQHLLNFFLLTMIFLN